jgi:sarcosine oxidase subunit alpha
MHAAQRWGGRVMAAFRLPVGGRIDRAQSLAIRFNGRALRGYVGDTVASLLLANGIHHVARSFKYHRPRGIVSHGPDEPSALLTVNRGQDRIDPNNRAAVVEAFDGLEVSSQNHWPSLNVDLAEVSDLVAPLFTAGFYYKTFKWPRRFWDWMYEPAIRRLAGLGKSPAKPDPDRYTSRYAHCEVLIVGGGPAGLAATLAASADPTKRIMLADEGPELGGALLHDVTSQIDGTPAQRWLAKAVETLSARDNVVLLSRTTAFGYYNHNFVGLCERLSDHVTDRQAGRPRERLWHVRAGRVILATGAHERPLTFANNDRPGIMLAESVRAFINRWGVAPGREIIVATNGPSAYQAALDAKAAGLSVTIVDARNEGNCGPELAAARDAGIKIWSRHTVKSARGRKRVSAVEIEAIGQMHRVVLPCDCVAMSGGWTPAVHLFSQSRGKLSFDETIDAFVPGTSVQQESSAGAAKGRYQLADCLADGFRVGAQAIGGEPSAAPAASDTFAGVSLSVSQDSDQGLAGRAFVDFQNDVTTKDVLLAVREGFESIEHVKRYTTTGMATDQGKTSNMSALKIVSQALDRPIPDIGTTTFRPPYTPVTFGTLVGPARQALFDPLRTTPIDSWAVENGAVFENVALWRRARYFPREGENMRAAVARECKAVRTSVGIFDATTLGKIEVVGPDAAEFLNRLYPNDWLKLAPGRCRYGLMLREDGYVMDDGVVARLADRFHVTTTTGGAARVLNHMEDYLQTEWPELDVFLTSITEQWAVIAIQGPRARDVVAPLVSEIDMSPRAFPHMAVREGAICSVPTRLFRVSFTGETGYEVNVPANKGRAVWQALWESGKPHGIVPYGTEAMHVLRAERGFIIVGQETDGTVSPGDLGLAGMISRAKPDFVGKRSLARPDLIARGRKQLVGLLTENPLEVLDEGAQIVDATSSSTRALGHVTSSYWSSNLRSSIALALLADGRDRHGQVFAVTTHAGFTKVRVTPPVFLDPTGVRVNA